MTEFRDEVVEHLWTLIEEFTRLQSERWRRPADILPLAAMLERESYWFEKKASLHSFPPDGPLDQLTAHVAEAAWLALLIRERGDGPDFLWLATRFKEKGETIRAIRGQILIAPSSAEGQD